MSFAPLDYATAQSIEKSLKTVQKAAAWLRLRPNHREALALLSPADRRSAPDGPKRCTCKGFGALDGGMRWLLGVVSCDP